MRRWLGILFGVTGLLFSRGALQAQSYEPLEIGVEAPVFALAGATADGMLPEPVRLSDFQGRTVVLAFFFKARTKG